MMNKQKYGVIELDVRLGDTILVGKFKNKRVKVKTIEYDEYGMPIINGKPACTFRMVPNPRSEDGEES
tara:strand:- start:2184 stop:2387 length:204 start_codon:yes stop_codon:yes gene_type:complete